MSKQLSTILDGLSPFVLAGIANVMIQEADEDFDDAECARELFREVLAAGQRNVGDEFANMLNIDRRLHD